MLKAAFDWGVVFFGVISAGCWIKAAVVKVSAPAGSNAGVGMGGVPVYVPLATGEVIDFLRSYPLQATWNSRAAFASGLTALCAALGAMIK